ncbi:hypothetical protein ACFL6M_03910 [Candidatus Eisenbacteria bacterium]|uniref:Zinc-finger domain-containing protein n=1 Tax=Eiseniibacteriota bacterium TaxID=2212470 RepID=A0ABV6YK72_UNCEI
MNPSPTSTPPGDARDRHLDEHLCLDLLHGFLSRTEAEQVLSHAQVCPSCERLLQERASEEERYQATMVLKTLPGGKLVLERRGTALRGGEEQGRRRLERLKRFLTALRERAWLLPGGHAKRLMRLQHLVPAAVVVVLLLLVLGPHLRETSDTPEPALLPSYAQQLQFRTSPDAESSEKLQAGLDAYDHRDFARTIEHLSSLDAADLEQVSAIVRDIYLGSALAMSGEYDDAVNVLEEVKFHRVPGVWGREAHWTLFVALEASGRKASADSLLQVLGQKSGEVGERARRLLEERK